MKEKHQVQQTKASHLYGYVEGVFDFCCKKQSKDFNFDGENETLAFKWANGTTTNNMR
jgi:hypothetical protein